MNFIVNAWLERADPLIQIFSAHTGDVLLSLDAAAVSSLLEEGDVTVTELQQTNSLVLTLDIYTGLLNKIKQGYQIKSIRV